MHLENIRLLTVVRFDVKHPVRTPVRYRSVTRARPSVGVMDKVSIGMIKSGLFIQKIQTSKKT